MQNRVEKFLTDYKKSDTYTSVYGEKKEEKPLIANREKMIEEKGEEFKLIPSYIDRIFDKVSLFEPTPFLVEAFKKDLV